MGCKSLSYSNFGTSLKVVHRDFDRIQKTCAGAYRYGFNGMESDDEIKGEGNSYTTEFRQYDPRLGRWLSIDPLFQNFPWQSPYVAFDNNPIVNRDPKGLAAENETSAEGGPGDRQRRLANKKNDLVFKKDMTSNVNKKDRLQNRINRLDSKINKLSNSSSTHFYDNNGGVSPNANGGKYKNNDLTNTGGEGDFVQYIIATDAPTINSLGYRTAVENIDGSLSVIQVGIPQAVDGGGFRPVWPLFNTFGQPVNSPVQINTNGDILDNNTGAVLLPLPSGVLSTDGFFQAGDNIERATGSTTTVILKPTARDVVVRYYDKITYDSQGVTKKWEETIQEITQSLIRARF